MRNDNVCEVVSRKVRGRVRRRSFEEEISLVILEETPSAATDCQVTSGPTVELVIREAELEGEQAVEAIELMVGAMLGEGEGQEQQVEEREGAPAVVEEREGAPAIEEESDNAAVVVEERKNVAVVVEEREKASSVKGAFIEEESEQQLQPDAPVADAASSSSSSSSDTEFLYSIVSGTIPPATDSEPSTSATALVRERALEVARALAVAVVVPPQLIPQQDEGFQHVQDEVLVDDVNLDVAAPVLLPDEAPVEALGQDPAQAQVQAPVGTPVLPPIQRQVPRYEFNNYDSLRHALRLQAFRSPSWSLFNGLLVQIQNEMLSFDRQQLKAEFNLEVSREYHLFRELRRNYSVFQNFVGYNNLDVSLFSNVNLLHQRNILKIMFRAAATYSVRLMRAYVEHDIICACSNRASLRPAYQQVGISLTDANLIVHCNVKTVNENCSKKDSLFQVYALRRILEETRTMSPGQSIFSCKLLLVSNMTLTILFKLRFCFEKILVLHFPTKNVHGVLFYKKEKGKNLTPMLDEGIRAVECMAAGRPIQEMTFEALDLVFDSNKMIRYNNYLLFQEISVILNNLQFRVPTYRILDN